MKVLAVEGNIGAGKSTLLPMLAKQLGYTYLLEPVDSDPEFKELLGKFCANPSCVHARNEFQMYITNQRADLLCNAAPNGKYLIERSLLSDLVFTHACMANYENTPEDAQHHMDSYKHLISRIMDYPKIDICLYLKTEPMTAFQRMRQRGREEEKKVPFSYIKDLSNYHDAVLPQACRKGGTKLVTVDWNVFKDTTWVIQTMLAEGAKL